MTRRGGSGERESGRLEVGVGVEGPGASLPPSTPPLLPFPLLDFSFSFFVDDMNSCLISREGELREVCGGVVAPSGEAMASSPSTTRLDGIRFLVIFASFFLFLLLSRRWNSNLDARKDPSARR